MVIEGGKGNLEWWECGMEREREKREIFFEG